MITSAFIYIYIYIYIIYIYIYTNLCTYPHIYIFFYLNTVTIHENTKAVSPEFIYTVKPHRIIRKQELFGAKYTRANGDVVPY